MKKKSQEFNNYISNNNNNNLKIMIAGEITKIIYK